MNAIEYKQYIDRIVARKYEPTINVLHTRVDGLQGMADYINDCDPMDDVEMQAATDEAIVAIRDLYKQCVGLVEIWPHREAELVQQCYDTWEPWLRTLVENNCAVHEMYRHTQDEDYL